ncbi:hypothetical protein AVEN_4918-1, partial [Araneus ventricosus]
SFQSWEKFKKKRCNSRHRGEETSEIPSRLEGLFWYPRLGWVPLLTWEPNPTEDTRIDPLISAVFPFLLTRSNKAYSLPPHRRPRWPSGKVSALGPEGSRFETRFH